MKKTGRILSIAVVAAFGVSLGAMTVSAAETTLRISSWAPPSHGMNSHMWPKLTKMIEKATDGRVTAEIKYKLASPPAQFDLVQDGAADLTWIFHGYTPGRFTATKLIELPGYKGSAEAASVSHWRAHQKYFAKLNEHKGVKLIALMTHGVGVLHSNKLVKSLSQIKGMKLRIGGGVAGDVGAALGATGIRVPAPKVYETLASKAADGVLMPMESHKGFKLTEVGKNVYQVPGGFYRGSFAVIMNQAKFDSLSEKDRKALNKVFGEAASRMAGKAWDEIDAGGKKAAETTPGNSINTATAADTAAWNKMAAAIRAKTLAEAAKKGIDAKAAVAFIAKDMAAQ